MAITDAVNRARTLHGGMISTLIDSVGSLAVASHGWFNTGISTDIHATFVKPGGMDGDTIRVTGEVIGIGTHVGLTSRKDTRLYTSGTSSHRDQSAIGYVNCDSRSLWQSHKVHPHGTRLAPQFGI